MDVNSINNNISTLNNQPSVELNKTGASNKIEKVDNESLSLSVNQYNQRRDELSLNVQSLNEGIAISKIAENSLNKQEDFLNDIKKNLESLKSDDNNLQDKNDIKDKINQDLQSFNQLAYETKFANKNILNVDYYDEQKNIEVNTSSENFSIDKPNTPQIANDIFEGLNESNLNLPDDLDKVLDRVETATRQIQTITNEFTDFWNKLESSARGTIQEQQNLYNEAKVNKNRNFGNESSDFTKTNVNANAGYLAASQANIVQEQSVRLLS